MKREPSSSRRGLKVLLLLAAAALAAGVGALAVVRPNSRALPNLTDAERLALSRDAYSRQDYARSLETLEPLVRDGRGDLETRLYLVQTLLELGRLARARDVLNALHKEFPHEARVVLGLGQMHERSGELDLAIASYKRASEMKKDDPRAFRLLGLAQIKRGDQMAALFSIRQSLKLLPGQEDLSRLLSEAGIARQSRPGLPDRSRATQGFDPFEDMNAHAGPGRDLMPPIPDPLRGLPRPDGRLR